MEASKQLKEQMREAFDKDDRYCRVRFSQMDQDSKQRPRYCATGDEKYYLDLPGKENEKVVNKLLMHYHFLAVQDSSISDIVGLSVCRSEPTNNQSLGSIKE